ncbi:MAG: lantibiotic dehydratase family protein [Methanomassiliicoccales archaeon]|nr:lantibiotic dehydratase family protein [Methanomassiliicoccales archaeon]
MSNEIMRNGQKQIRLDKKDIEQISLARAGATKPVVCYHANDRSKLNWGDFALGAIVGIGAYMVLKALTDEGRK